MAALLAPLLLAPATNAPQRRRAQVASGWLVLPLLLSLGSARGGGKLQLRGDDPGQIEFEQTGTAKLIGDETSINATVDLVVGGDLTVGDQTAPAVSVLQLGECTISNVPGTSRISLGAGCELDAVSALQQEVQLNVSALRQEVEELKRHVGLTPPSSPPVSPPALPPFPAVSFTYRDQAWATGGDPSALASSTVKSLTLKGDAIDYPVELNGWTASRTISWIIKFANEGTYTPLFVDGNTDESGTWYAPSARNVDADDLSMRNGRPPTPLCAPPPPCAPQRLLASDGIAEGRADC